jgi:3-hydroxy-9,10-secoandrosta-1,3,5(10)-triene-9,17-dione monooxygenase
MIESLYLARSLETLTEEERVTAELLEKIRSLAPQIRERADDFAKAGGYDLDLHHELLEAGLYGVLVPKKYGGLGLGLDSYVQIGVELARADPGVAWMFVLGAGHAFHAGSFFGEKAQDELFGNGPYIAPLRAIPSGRSQRVEGGYRLSGDFPFSSGSRYSTHTQAVAPTHDEAGTYIGAMLHSVPREQYEILDDWGGGRTIGMEASSSNTIRITDVFVPDHLVVPYSFREHILGEHGTPGYQQHANPLYVGRSMTFTNAELVSTQVGAARAALDEYEKLMLKGKSAIPPFAPRLDSPEYHRWFGKLQALVDTAETTLYAATRQYMTLARRWAGTGADFSPADDVRLRAIVQQAGKLANEATDLAFTTAGTSAAAKGTRLEKIFRDVSMSRTHIVVAQLDVHYTSASEYHFGQPLRF